MILYLLLFFILGSAIGSFLNVVIDRVTNRQSILGRSYCDHCKATLSSVDLIPIISFVGLGGKCRRCKKPLSFQYPLVEGVVGALFAFSFYFLSLQGTLDFSTLLLYLFLISIFAVVFVVDLKYYLIPTTLVFLAALVTLFYNYFAYDSSVFISHVFSAFGLAFFFVTIVVVTRGRGMGVGDIPLAFLMGLLLGATNTIIAIFVSFLLGALVSVGLLAFGKKKIGQAIPFGPFMILGTLSALFFADQLSSWYFSLL